MECNYCGGSVLWQGPISNFTHTECLSCGAINSQKIEDDEDEDECECDTLGSECSSCEVEV